jgi:hypothetical protein
MGFTPMAVVSLVAQPGCACTREGSGEGLVYPFVAILNASANIKPVVEADRFYDRCSSVVLRRPKKARDTIEIYGTRRKIWREVPDKQQRRDIHTSADDGT